MSPPTTLLAMRVWNSETTYLSVCHGPWIPKLAPNIHASGTRARVARVRAAPTCAVSGWTARSASRQHSTVAPKKGLVAPRAQEGFFQLDRGSSCSLFENTFNVSVKNTTIYQHETAPGDTPHAAVVVASQGVTLQTLNIMGKGQMCSSTSTFQ